jgi:UDP-glucose 4-epimerase
MQLITGGMGFIGLHTARAFLDMGEPCVLTQYRATREPDFIRDEIGKRIFVERLDVFDRAAMLDVQKRHKITGIVHLSGANPRGYDPCEFMRLNTIALLNVLEATQKWRVPRVSIASTIGVYAGADAGAGPFREDLPLPMNVYHPIPSSKKITELLASAVGSGAGFEAVNFRFSVWGPLFHHPPSPMNVAAQMIRAAVKGETMDFTQPQSRAYAEDGGDSCYVKDCARGIALLQLAGKLNHRTYNIGTGHAMKNREFVAAIKRIIPGATFDLPEGFDPQGPGRVFDLDITRLRQDTGYEPQYDVERGVADYIAWLRAGHGE